jgi:hypothetical protein
MRKTVAICCFFLGISICAFSQVTTPLSLPFFDDFAKQNQLDGSKWVLKGGVFINNTFSTSPLTKNIATFNGVSSDGLLPTATGAVTAGPMDTLTSKPINLAGFAVSDSIYLSFYLQAGGDIWNGPSNNAFFVVEFKNNAGVWLQAFRLNGPVNGFVDFTQVLLPVKNPIYFHNNFQFRFRNVGVKRLDRDNWNLDYIFLNNNRTRLKTDTFDIAISRPVTSLLKRYTAMPIHQFNANIADELSNSITTTVTNLENSPRSLTFEASIKVNGTVTGPTPFSAIPIVALGRQQNPLNPFSPSASLFSGLSGFQVITHKLNLITNEGNIPTQYNDTISRTTELHDYFAYDDGSAEDRVNAAVPVTLGQVAIMFKANQPDMVKEMRVYLPRVNNTPGTTATFRIWNPDPNSNNNPSNQSVFTRAYVVPALNQLDNWVNIPVNPPVPVNGGFYVGWSVNNAPNIFSVGVDHNESDRGMIRFYNGGSSWSVFNAGYAIMLRPVMNNNITGLAEDQLAAGTIKLFPNPATDFVTIQGEFEKGILLDATGRQVREFSGTSTETQLNVQQLPAGLYLVKLQNKSTVQTHKLIIKPN